MSYGYYPLAFVLQHIQAHSHRITSPRYAQADGSTKLAALGPSKLHINVVVVSEQTSRHAAVSKS